MADLATAHARGQDLGSRGLHIQADDAALAKISVRFESQIDDLDGVLDRLGAQDRVSSELLRGLLEMVHELADTAQRFPHGL